ncbi:hypothetical protein D3C80_1362510 [compost metagenome]
MAQLQVLLLVHILQRRIPQPDQGAVLIELVLATNKVEAVRHATAVAHVVHAGVVARAVAAELPAIQGQPGNLVGRDLPATERLWQRTPVVRAQNRKHRHPLTDLQFCSGDACLARHCQAPIVIGRLAIVMARQQRRAIGTATAIQLDRPQPQYIHAEADRPLGEPRAGVEDEALRPFLGLALRVARVGEVAVDVEVAQAEGGLAVLDKTRRQAGTWQAGDNPGAKQREGQGMADLHYCYAPEGYGSPSTGHAQAACGRGG